MKPATPELASLIRTLRGIAQARGTDCASLVVRKDGRAELSVLGPGTDCAVEKYDTDEAGAIKQVALYSYPRGDR